MRFIDLRVVDAEGASELRACTGWPSAGVVQVCLDGAEQLVMAVPDELHLEFTPSCRLPPDRFGDDRVVGDHGDHAACGTDEAVKLSFRSQPRHGRQFVLANVDGDEVPQRLRDARRRSAQRAMHLQPSAQRLFDLEVPALVLAAGATSQPDAGMQQSKVSGVEVLGLQPLLDGTLDGGDPVDSRQVGDDHPIVGVELRLDLHMCPCAHRRSTSVLIPVARLAAATPVPVDYLETARSEPALDVDVAIGHLVAPRILLGPFPRGERSPTGSTPGPREERQATSGVGR